MLSPDNFQYAMESTRVVLPPQKRLETFGTTLVNYHLITEHMDSVNTATVREGQISAAQPQIISSASLSKLILEGFGEKAESFAEWLSQHGRNLAILKYGFNIRKAEIKTYHITDSIEVVTDRVTVAVKEKKDPLSAVLVGVDDAWEVCLLKFMLDISAASAPDQVKDYRDLGFL